MAASNSDKSPREQEVDAGKEAVLAAYNNLLEATEHFKQAARAAGLDLRQEAGEQLVKGRDKAVAVGQEASDYVHQKPLQALGLAFVAGLLLAQVFGRR
ncbi:MAG: hypothetical protein WDA10_02915 [Porticoccaceae bacterium]|jgi:ElaB/YqjD/DUF883 family membrane-anchored ribosome-binding protein|nr:hypothetical protein [Porticoccaceae bacterium]HLS99283.1 hypothetical protein [Porticoccaceae bacterium]